MIMLIESLAGCACRAKSAACEQQLWRMLFIMQCISPADKQAG